MYNRDTEGEVTGFNKFCVDLNASLYKRFIQLLRDYKTLILEVICPIILVLIGLVIANVDFSKDSLPKEFSLSLLPTPQTTYYASTPYKSSDISPSNIFQSNAFQNFEAYDNSKKTFTNPIDALVEFNNYIFNYNKTTQMAGYYTLNMDNNKNIYDSIIFINTVAQDSAPIFYQDHLNKMINAISGKTVKISVKI